MIRVLLADDQALVRSGLKMILEDQPDIVVVADAEDGEEAVELARRTKPDVVLMDIRMPNMDGIEATRRLTADSSRTRVVILTTFDLDEYVYDALVAGASGFLLKNLPPTELASAVRFAAAGNALLAPSATQLLIEQFAKASGGAEAARSLETLSEREIEVLSLVARAMSNAEIAQNLLLSQNTVKSHVSHLLQKLNLRDRVQLAIFAYEAGLAHSAMPPSGVEPGFTA
jgi:DNA-binding NarL/FixJ family response regulator